MPRFAPQIPQLQDRLALFRFLCAQFGAPSGFGPLRDWLKNTQQAPADDGHSQFFHALAAQSGLKLPEEKLSEYDLRIKRYVERLNAANPSDYVTVVLPEFVPAKWWHHLFHNQRALLIKGALLFRPNTVVTSVPFHLSH